MIIEGFFVKQLFCDEGSGLRIFKLKTLTKGIETDTSNCIVCKGEIIPYHPKVPLLLEGEMSTDDKNRTAFCFTSYKEGCGTFKEKAELLKSIKGVGERISLNILKTFSEGSLFDIGDIPNVKTKLIKCCLDDEAIAESILDYFEEIKSKRKLTTFIRKFKCSPHYASKLCKKYGSKAYNKFIDNPYKYGTVVDMPLDKLDAIGESLNISPTYEWRIRSHVTKILKDDNTAGNCYIPRNTLIKKAKTSLNITSDFPISLSLGFDTSITSEIYDEEEILYKTAISNAEKNVGKQIRRLINNSVQLPFTDNLIEIAEKEVGFTYPEEKKKAFDLLKQTGIGVITGGAGTGKTSTLKGMLAAYKTMMPNGVIALAAPTGRAAQRMTDATGVEALTVHRLVGYNPFESGIECQYNEENPLNADLIVIDESSMLDIVTASLLFSAVKTNAIIMLLGDINQLQAVGAGDILNSLIVSGKVPVVKLETVHRQGKDSNILYNATNIIRGINSFKEGDDFEIVIVDNEEDLSDKASQIAESYHKSDKPYYCQVICPTHKGNGSVGAVNSLLQRKLNDKGKNGITYGQIKYLEGDKVIMLTNNVKEGYYNGDIGIITGIEENSVVITLEGGKVINISREDMGTFKLAYSMTIHKVQGSEFNVTVICLPDVSMITKNLFYTAVTRAKEKVIIVTVKNVLNKAVGREVTHKRRSRLVERIKEEE